MSHLKLQLDDKTYQRLNTMFKGDEKAIHDFVVKTLTDKLANNSIDETKENADIKPSDLEDYLKSGKSGSRSYGIKGQGW